MGALTEQETVYEAAGGEAGMLLLARAWRERVLVDEVVGHAFRHGFDPHHTERLSACWGETLGGPPTSSTRYGDEAAVVRIHSGDGAHDAIDDHPVACFDRALEDVGIEPDDRLHPVLHDCFAWATRTAMAAYPDSPDDVPDGLRIPRWSWEGLVRG